MYDLLCLSYLFLFRPEIYDPEKTKSGRQDLNLRPLRPERSALAKLSYSPRGKRAIVQIFLEIASYKTPTGSISI